MSVLHPILILLTAYLAVFVEASFDGPRHWLGAQIDLLPCLMVYISLSFNLFIMTSAAILMGFWFDSLSANPLGVTMLPLFLVGFVIHQRRALILREQLFAQFVLGLSASAIVPLLALLLVLSLRQAPLLGWGSLWQWLVMSVGGAFLTPVCFKVFDTLVRALTYQPLVQSSYRPDREIRRGR